MTTIRPLTPESADTGMAATLNGIRAKLGMVPNLYATLAHAPAALNGLLQLNAAIAAGRLSAAEREVIALSTSQGNGCQYCLSAHTLLGKNAGLSAEQIAQARAGAGGSERMAAIAALSKALVQHDGHVAPGDIDRFRAAGLSDGDLMEVVANVAATTFTNYANNLARTEIDFPAVPLALAA